MRVWLFRRVALGGIDTLSKSTVVDRTPLNSCFTMIAVCASQERGLMEGF
jgi:hypothetical protein